jgi:hypothetical protein
MTNEELMSEIHALREENVKMLDLISMVVTAIETLQFEVKNMKNRLPPQEE